MERAAVLVTTLEGRVFSRRTVGVSARFQKRSMGAKKKETPSVHCLDKDEGYAEPKGER